MEDLYFEHSQHNTYTEGCSTCYSEARLIKNFTTVNRDRDVNEHNTFVLGGVFLTFLFCVLFQTAYFNKLLLMKFDGILFPRKCDKPTIPIIPNLGSCLVDN